MSERRARAAMLAAAAAIALALPDVAAAQAPADTARSAPASAPPAALGLEPGRRVRVELRGYGGRVAGVIDSVLAGAFVLDTASRGTSLPFIARGPELLAPYRTMRVGYDEIARLDVSRGSSRARGAILWGLIGAGAGALLTGLSEAPERNPEGRDFVGSALPGAIVGAVIGGTLGYFTGRERWAPAGWP